MIKYIIVGVDKENNEYVWNKKYDEFSDCWYQFKQVFNERDYINGILYNNEMDAIDMVNEIRTLRNTNITKIKIKEISI